MNSLVSSDEEDLLIGVEAVLDGWWTEGGVAAGARYEYETGLCNYRSE